MPQTYSFEKGLLAVGRRIAHDKWVPVTMAWRVLRLLIEVWPPIWMVATNILNKQSQPARDGSPAWGLGEVLTNPHRKEWPCYETDTCALELD
jgi:hypothetical protein